MKIKSPAMINLEETPIADSTPARVPPAAPRLSVDSVVVDSRGREDVVQVSRRKYHQRSCLIDSSAVDLEEWVAAALVRNPQNAFSRLASRSNRLIFSFGMVYFQRHHVCCYYLH